MPLCHRTECRVRLCEIRVRSQRRISLGIALWLATLIPQSATAADQEKLNDRPVRSFLMQHCLDCHSGDKPQGNLRLDQLATEFDNETRRKPWRSVLKRVHAGEMPPKDEPRPPEKELAEFSNSLRAQLHQAETEERAREGRVILRRLNRTEYENTVRDLLGVTVELKELLPLDNSADGFDNVGDALHISSFLMERYLETADTALSAAIANLPQPPLIKKRYSLQETHQVKLSSENVFRKSDDGRVVNFTSVPWQSVVLSPFYPPDRGNYRFRISAAGVQSAGKPVTYRVDAGTMLMGSKPNLIGYFDAPPDESKVVEFVDSMESRSTIRISPYGLARSNEVHKIGAENYEGPGLAVDWVDVEGPLHDSWPPESHRRIFGDLPLALSPIYNRSDRVEVVSENPSGDARRILRKFVRRAFRRPVTDADLEPYFALVDTKLAEKHSFEKAVRVALLAVLVSPEFLFLREVPGRLNDHALASRLSYFLWSGPPDEELLLAADEGKLAGSKSSLTDQVERMLEAPKSRQFVQNFVGQWLGLRDIDFTEPSYYVYPEYDEMLKASMVREVELFFAELLKDDLSLANFVASDFSMLNGRLAKHYGIPDIDGWEFHKTPLPPDSHRGGVLTMAGVLKVTANGTSTSPITRGAWVLERIQGITPPRPPANVPALEPDIRGATTIREQLAKHRQIADCKGCHAQIDPPGFALESFDVIGGWREEYRIFGWRNGAKEVTVDGKKMPYLHLGTVDPSDALSDGRAFRNIDEFKQLLLADKDQLARALTLKLVTYATGGAPASLDQAEIESLVAKVRAKNYGLRSLVHEIVQSDLFRRK